MATHAEKDKIIKELKSRLEAAEVLINRNRGEDGELSELGFSVIKDNKMFKLVEISFDLHSKKARVYDIVDLNKDYAISLFKVKKFLIEKIMKKLS